MTPIIGVIASSILKSNAAFDSIATVTGNGSSNTLTFSSIPQTYKSLHVRIYGQNTSTLVDSPGFFTCPSLTVGTVYTMGQIFYDINSSILFTNGISDARVGRAATSSTAWSNTTTPTMLDIYNYTSTSIGKTWRSFSGGNVASTSWSNMALIWGSNNSTSAITSLSFNSGNPFTANTRIALYGVK
jgi:hypothetical protein